MSRALTSEYPTGSLPLCEECIGDVEHAAAGRQNHFGKVSHSDASAFERYTRSSQPSS